MAIIYDSNANPVVYYKYDAWGSILSITGSLASTVGQINPFRYRSYYYDTETGFYYLNSRYYDPSVGRFLNADGILGANGGIIGYNMFAYCNNNPVMFSDPSGYCAYGAFAGLQYQNYGAKDANPGDKCKFCGEVFTSFSLHRYYIQSFGSIDCRIVRAPKNVVSDPTHKGQSTCFTAGTLVLTEDGNVAIETIEAGDMVWAEDPETGEKELKRVVQTFVREVDQLVYVYVDGQIIETTEEHPFWVVGQGWTEAALLKVGDMLKLENGKTLPVEKIEFE